jgi:hypothetical protein
MKDKAFMIKTNPGLANDAIINPKIAGPTARPIFNETPPSVIVAGISGFETISRVMAIDDGILIAAPAPNIKVSNNRIVGVTSSPIVKNPKVMATTNMYPCVIKSSFLRSTTSAKPPAKSDNKTIARAVEVCNSATIRGD